MRQTIQASNWRTWVLFLAFGPGLFAYAGPVPEWKPIRWNEERAWEMSDAGWVAVVSSERGRLVSLSEKGSGKNLLFVAPASNRFWSGHLCWFGPQSSWKVAWPPVADWGGGAEMVTVSGRRMELKLPHRDSDYPQMTRGYEWRDGILYCDISWRSERPLSAIQIFQIQPWAVVQVRVEPGPGLPLGYELLPLWNRREISTGKKIAEGVGKQEGNNLTLWHANVSEKIGVLPQSIRAKLDGGQLTLGRGKSSGLGKGWPNQGLATQIYLGGRENPFIEIEQVSGMGQAKECSFGVWIKPERLK